MHIDFFLDNIIYEQVVITFNLFANPKYEFNNFGWCSKTKNNGDLFVAINGANTSGNFFLDQVVEEGYRAVISDNLFIVQEKSKIYSNVIFIIVKDVHATLNLMAAWGVKQFRGMKLAVTGSNGKTTTTYLLSNLLKHFGKVVYTDKYNSQFFLKRLCFFLHQSDANFFVAELSSDHFGYIDLYGSIIQPDYSIVTSIDNAHLEHFKSEQVILLEKTSLFLHTKKAGYIPYTYKNKVEMELKGKLKNVEYVPNDFKIEDNKVIFYNGIELINPKFHGVHNYSNINLILRLMDKMGFGDNRQKITETLTNINCFPGRGNKITIATPEFKLNLTCEHHNCNTSSFISAISNIKEPTLVIMGYLYELAEATERDINRILSIMEANQYVTSIFFGDRKLFNINGINQYKKIIPYDKEILSIVEQSMNKGVYNIFLKGSRGSKLEKYMEKILEKFSI